MVRVAVAAPGAMLQAHLVHFEGAQLADGERPLMQWQETTWRNLNQPQKIRPTNPRQLPFVIISPKSNNETTTKGFNDFTPNGYGTKEPLIRYALQSVLKKTCHIV